MDGILNINKPQGLTSFGVVARVKRITAERHTGHAGTLDPLAGGVLPVCLGKATRVIEYLFNETKHYRAEVQLGITTDTFDVTGKIIRTVDPGGISREMVEAALDRFRGTILQTPPMYSALKHHGQPLYKLARAGIEVERKGRPAQIHSLEITSWQPPVFTLDIICGKGTYIRSLAHDLGEALGTGAVMKTLTRLRVGPFSLEDSITLPQLEEAFRSGYGEKYLYPLDFVLLHLPALIVGRELQCALVHGSPITPQSDHRVGPEPAKDGDLSRVYDTEGRFLGIARFDALNGNWRPDKIFAQPCCRP